MVFDNDGLTDLREEWREFLRSDPDAYLIILRLMERMGFTDDEVLSHLIEAWVEQSLIKEEQRGRCLFRKMN